jgi:phosphoribosyl-AMP cyclohydrolase
MSEAISRDSFMAAVAFNAEGLVPAIAQDSKSGAVLMLAWMNRQSLEMTLAIGDVTYWSRSRGELWTKGATSGHKQKLVEVFIDCDGDALLLKVDQTGAACHTGNRVCFYRKLAR